MISKLVFGIIFLCVLLLSLAFGGENGQIVALDLVFITLPAMPLFALTLGAIAVGILLGLLPALVLIPMLRLRISAMQNRIEMLEATTTE